MAWVMRKSISVQDSPLVRWTPETIEEILKANASVVAQYCHLPLDHPDYIAMGDAPVGHHIPWSGTPRVAVIEKLEGPLPDALTSTIVNDRIKQAVEGIEPDTHQFIPTIVTLPDGSKEESWWSMRFCHRIDALAIDHCEDVFEYRPKPEQYPNLYYYRSNEDNRMRLAVHKDRIAGKAIWSDWRFKHDFCSQELGQFFIDNGIQGYRLKLEDDLMRSNHVIEV